MDLIRKAVDGVDGFEATRTGVPEGREQVRRARAGRRFSDRERRVWAWDELPQPPRSVQLPADFSPARLGGIKEEFMAKADLRDCPLITVEQAYRDGWLVAQGGGEAPSDFEDRVHLIGVAYCETAFVDKRTLEALRKGKCERLPRANGAFDHWLAAVSEGRSADA
jgi:hypothetical protein